MSNNWKPYRVTNEKYSYYCKCSVCGSLDIWQIEKEVYPCDIPLCKCNNCGYEATIAEFYSNANNENDCLTLTAEKKTTH